MKTAMTLLAAIACSLSLSAPALADGWKTLAGVNDSVKLAAGETAFVVTVSENVTVQYERPRKRSIQFELGAEYERRSHKIGSRRDVVIPTTVNPFPLVGPCTISVKSPGVVSMKVVRTVTDVR
jgi:hypothetical protein